jgi:spermidine synthase
MRLFRDGEHYVIKLADGSDLMSTRTHGSEDALAELTCARFAARPQARVLIGGLGMGFTLAAALRNLGETAQVTVAELIPNVVTWNQGPMGGRSGHPLSDPRVGVHVGDVRSLIKQPHAAWDAILLDVDNGPDGLTQGSNSWLYAKPGLVAAHAALRAHGVLSVWSAHSDHTFTQRLEKAGFAVEEIPVRAHGKRGLRHRIWLATRA